MSIGIYAGTFDPFTNGHLEIVKQAADIFGFVYVVFAKNDTKKRAYDEHWMISATKMTLIDNGLTNVYVDKTADLITKYAKEKGANYLVRGLRNPNDYNYEEDLAKTNKELDPDLKTIYLRADKHEILSSSFVKGLIKYNIDISKYVSSHVKNVITIGGIPHNYDHEKYGDLNEKISEYQNNK